MSCTSSGSEREENCVYPASSQNSVVSRWPCQDAVRLRHLRQEELLALHKTAARHRRQSQDRRGGSERALGGPSKVSRDAIREIVEIPQTTKPQEARDQHDRVLVVHVAYNVGRCLAANTSQRFPMNIRPNLARASIRWRSLVAPGTRKVVSCRKKSEI